MRTKLCAILSIIIVLILASCGNSPETEGPNNQVMQDDVQAFINEILNTQDSISSFQVVSKELVNRSFLATCIVEYGTEKSEFSIEYENDQGDWRLTNCRRVENHTAEQVENEADVVEGSADGGQAISATDSAESYKVHFVLGGGELVSGEALQVVEAGGSAVAPVVERDRYQFDGWDKEFDSVTENLVVTAQWTRLFTIRFDPNGGQAESGALEQQIAAGSVPEKPTVSREDAEFLSWEPGIQPASTDMVYTARWSKLAYDGEQVYTRIYASVAEISVFDAAGMKTSLGTGFFIDRYGTLVTNFHVIDDAYTATATLYDGTVRDITYVLDYDASLDLALVHVDVQDNDFLMLCQDGVAIGETVYALGSSLGLTNTFSSGIISAAAREIDGVSCIQTTTPISPGNSGGPLVNTYCEVVGINAMGINDGQNLNFAISVDELECLDASGYISWEEYRDAVGTNAATAGGQVGFYDYAEYREVENNDDYSCANNMIFDVLVAAELTNADDWDYYAFYADSACDVHVDVLAFYTEDEDYLSVAVAQYGEITNEYTQIVSMDSMTGSGTLTVHLPEGGDYFLVFYLRGNYPYTDPSYYIFYLDLVPATTSDYLLPNSDTEYVTEEDLADLTWEECCLARNEIYARHGRIFLTPEIAAYFESKSWYEGTIPGAEFDANTGAYLSEIERRNVETIQAYEQAHWGGSYY